jgi:hypothetical protein
MGRQPRLVADGRIKHALHRGNHCAAVFRTAADYLVFVDALQQTRTRYPFRLYEFCLMGNPLPLELEPDSGQSIRRILQGKRPATKRIWPSFNFFRDWMYCTP